VRQRTYPSEALWRRSKTHRQAQGDEQSRTIAAILNPLFSILSASMIVKCPTCRREVEWENNPHRPFCSERCQLIDLGAWTEERYRIPGEKLGKNPDDEDDDGDEKAG
jgi:endogenous inhibitor of DNA gyrase (YacG/DUF329 family)